MISIQIYKDAHTRQKNNSNNNIFFFWKKNNNWMVDWSLIYCCIFCSGCFLYKWHITYTHHHWFDQIRSCGFFFLSLAIITHCYIHYILGWFDPTVDHHHHHHGLYIFYNIIIWIEKKITNLIISNWICLKGQHT